MLSVSIFIMLAGVKLARMAAERMEVGRIENRAD